MHLQKAIILPIKPVHALTRQILLHRNGARVGMKIVITREASISTHDAYSYRRCSRPSWPSLCRTTELGRPTDCDIEGSWSSSVGVGLKREQGIVQRHLQSGDHQRQRYRRSKIHNFISILRARVLRRPL